MGEKASTITVDLVRVESALQRFQSVGELTVEQLQACREAVAFAGYSYFAARGPAFVNELMYALADAVKKAREGAVQ